MSLIPTRANMIALSLSCMAGMAQAADLPKLPPMPDIPAPKAVNSVPLGNSRNAPEVNLDLPIAPGPFEPTWASIEKNYPGNPAWLREAKFGIWVHFGPQSAGESGDWYARKLYTESMPAYANHLKMFGHPTETGYMGE
jgi:alpha-L-fucosidase